ncbi:MAG TPA: hypothetical protein VNI55_02250 [Gaiellaceae bacterium]|nr:hypothetical protein [Gaiellaceae bacterium]
MTDDDKTERGQDEPDELELDDWKGVYPGMCRDPELCRGRGSCPRDYSCCE